LRKFLWVGLNSQTQQGCGGWGRGGRLTLMALLYGVWADAHERVPTVPSSSVNVVS
jgi:hypothetical protein